MKNNRDLKKEMLKDKTLKTVHQDDFKIGVSSCLLGRKVRFDAGHKKDDFITNILGRFVTFVPVCPEIEVGMGVPREAVHLKGATDDPRMLGSKSGIDWTDKMNRYTAKRVAKKDMLQLSGFILKKKSPTCGMERVKVYSLKHIPENNGIGLFAKSLMEKYPYLPVEEEGRLQDTNLRENFVVRIFAFNRLQQLYAGRFHRGKFVEFHTAHKYLMLAHSPKHYTQLGQLIGKIKQTEPSQLKDKYRSLFMEGLKVKSTAKKNTNVLQHIIGYMKQELTSFEKQTILHTIEDYRKGLTPLIVPITLIKHFIEKYQKDYILNQIYLSPHPKELMLRNHV